MEQTLIWGPEIGLDGLFGLPATPAPEAGRRAVRPGRFRVEIDRLGDLPSKITMSQLANFISAPKKPPELEQAMALVRAPFGDHRVAAPVEAMVPVSGPWT